MSPSRDAEAAKRFFEKALHSTADSASCTCSAQEQAAQPTTATDPNLTPSAPRVINVNKNAAYPKALADLKVVGMLLASVELKTASNT